jgi:hypothetical protein
MHLPANTVIVVYCDNVSAIYMSSNPVQNRCTKHIEINIHFVREKVALGQVHVPSPSQFVDIMTKGLPTALFDDFRSSLCARQAPAQTMQGRGGVLLCIVGHSIYLVCNLYTCTSGNI